MWFSPEGKKTFHQLLEIIKVILNMKIVKIVFCILSYQLDMKLDIHKYIMIQWSNLQDKICIFIFTMHVEWISTFVWSTYLAKDIAFSQNDKKCKILKEQLTTHCVGVSGNFFVSHKKIHLGNAILLPPFYDTFKQINFFWWTFRNHLENHYVAWGKVIENLIKNCECC